MGANDCEMCGQDAGPDGLFHADEIGGAVCGTCDQKLAERGDNPVAEMMQAAYDRDDALCDAARDAGKVTLSFTAEELNAVEVALGIAANRFTNFGKNGQPMATMLRDLSRRVQNAGQS